MLSVALSLTRLRPRATADRRALPGTVVPWSPDFPRWSKLHRGRPTLWRARYRGMIAALPVRLLTSAWVESGRTVPRVTPNYEPNADLIQRRMFFGRCSTRAAALVKRRRACG